MYIIAYGGGGRAIVVVHRATMIIIINWISYIVCEILIEPA